MNIQSLLPKLPDDAAVTSINSTDISTPLQENKSQDSDARPNMSLTGLLAGKSREVASLLQ